MIKIVKKILLKFITYLRIQLRKSEIQKIKRLIDSKKFKDIKNHGYFDEEFDKLQNEFPEYPPYGYEKFDLFNRAQDRFKELINLTEEYKDNSFKILEIGCGDGITGLLLSIYGHDVTLTDIEDWRHDSARALKFTENDISEGLNYSDNSFDLIYSYNSFEHFLNPEKALKEMKRICKKGGLIFLGFGPIFSGPWGLHAYRSIKIAYPQYLFSPDCISSKLKELGINDLGKKRDELQPLNKLTFQNYVKLFQNSGLDVLKLDKEYDNSNVSIILKYWEAFAGSGLDYDDLTVHYICVKLMKPV